MQALALKGSKSGSEKDADDYDTKAESAESKKPSKKKHTKEKSKPEPAPPTMPSGTKAADLDADEDTKAAEAKQKKDEEDKALHTARVLNGDAQHNNDEPDTKPADPKALAAQLEHKEQIQSALDYIKNNVKQS